MKSERGLARTKSRLVDSLRGLEELRATTKAADAKPEWNSVAPFTLVGAHA